jgi:hypothetical protein
VTCPDMDSTEYPREPHTDAAARRADQLAANCVFLIRKIDVIHRCLCPGQRGTWQQRAEQAAEAALELEARWKAGAASPVDVVTTRDKSLRDAPAPPGMRFLERSLQVELRRLRTYEARSFDQGPSPGTPADQDATVAVANHAGKVEYRFSIAPGFWCSERFTFAGVELVARNQVDGVVIAVPINT